MFFAGTCIGSMVIPMIADQIGRKKIVAIGLFVQWIIYTAIMFNHNLNFCMYSGSC